jgi:heme exporter protein D
MKPYFDSFAALAAMDGHGAYVWAAFAVTLVILLWLVISPLYQARQFFNRQAQMQARQAVAAKPQDRPE